MPYNVLSCLLQWSHQNVDYVTMIGFYICEKRQSIHLETLKDVHRLVDMITTDKNSGYDHVRLSVESRIFFGIQFGGR